MDPLIRMSGSCTGFATSAAFAAGHRLGAGGNGADDATFLAHTTAGSSEDVKSSASQMDQSAAGIKFKTAVTEAGLQAPAV